MTAGAGDFGGLTPSPRYAGESESEISNSKSQISYPLSPAYGGEGEIHEALDRIWSRRAGIYGWLTATNHKTIGLRFVCTAFVFFLLAGLLALLMRTQLAIPENNFLGPDQYNQFFTTHGSAMMFLFAVPVMEGMAVYLVPLMLGTRNMAFPRLVTFAYWTYLFGGLILFGGLFCNTGPDMGWFSYTPLAGPEYSPGKRVDLWSQMVTLVEIASMSGAVSIIVTILKFRAPGMSLNRLPLYCWSVLVMSFMVLFAMPAVTLCSTLLSMDRLTNVSTHVFNPAEGGDSLLWQHLFWFFGHPDVYIFFLPATGFISAILPTFARRKMFGYTPLVLSMISVGFIGFGVWVHHMFATPLPELGQSLFTASSMMIVIPSGIQIFCWTATLWGAGRKLQLPSPMLFILGFFGIFIMGGLTGVMLASVSIDTQVHDTHFVVAHLHYVLIGGGVFPLFAAIHYWFPKMTGRMMNERLAAISCLLLFLGFNLTFFPLHQLGLHGMTRRVYTYLPQTGWGPLNFIATCGAYLMGLGVLAFLINVIHSRRHGRIAVPNPWHSPSLEWATECPAPAYNFAYPPTAQGRYPLWDNRPDAPVVSGLDTKDKREMLCTTLLDAAPHHRYAMAGDSIWPILLALGVAGSLLWGMFHPVGVPIMCIPIGLALFGWFWASGNHRISPSKKSVLPR